MNKLNLATLLQNKDFGLATQKLFRQEIKQLLSDRQLENNFNQSYTDLWHDDKYINELEATLNKFITGLGFDLNSSTMSLTPKRMVKLFLEDLFWGLDYNNFPELSFDDNSFNYASPIISKNINFHSTCEHHFVAIRGYVNIGYIPHTRLIGLGKLNGIVNFFAHRPQIQERLTSQLFVVLQYLLDTKDVFVAIKASHDCILRGSKSNKTNEVLSFDLGGKFLTDEALKATVYNSIMK